jgi:hypothetical protein
MNARPTSSRLIAGLTLILAFGLPLTASANVVDEENEIYLVRPLVTEPAWTQTGIYFNSMLFDLPNAVSRPSAQVGFVFTPGITWSAFDIIELNVGFPLVINPDETGDQELDAAKRNPELKRAPQWDGSPDFDMPGLLVGLKANVLGKKKRDRFFLAVGVMTSIPLGDDWSTNFMAPKTTFGHSSSFRASPYISAAYNIGRFSPQLQVGATIRMPEKYYDPAEPPVEGDELPTKGYTDFFFNLALPFAFLYEHTAPILEINGIFGEEGSQIFITPGVTFLPKSSPALLSFACMIPILDNDFRENEGFRFMVNFSYRLDMLSIAALGGEEEESASDETPPAGW